MKKNNIKYLTYFKALTMILVIIGHIDAYNGLIKSYIYSFHMPAFFMIYGFIKFNGSDIFINIKEYFLKKFRSLIVPYMLWGLIYSGIGIASVLAILYGSHVSLKEFSNSSLWFLPTYFISVILYDLLSQLFRNKKESVKIILNITCFVILLCISMFIPSSDIGYIWGIDVSILGASLMMLGSVIRYFFDKINYTNKKTIFLISIALLLFLFSLVYKYNNVSYVLFAEKIVGNIPLFLVSSIVGFLLIMTISILLERIKIDLFDKLLMLIGSNTLVFFAAQRRVISIVEKAVQFIGVNDMLLGLVIVTCVTIICCSFASLFINSFIPELNGKQKN